MPDGDADLIFDLIENEQQILSDYEDAANNYDRSQSSAFVPIGLRFTALFKGPPSEVLALLEE